MFPQAISIGRRVRRFAWRPLLLGALAAAAAPRAGAVEYFFDDFEAYFSDADLAGVGWRLLDVNQPLEDATWTIVNPAGRGPVPGARGAPDDGFQFLISDSDAAGGENPPGSGMSHDAWSPPFSTTGASVVWLHFDATVQLNNNGQAVFDVDVSVDGGETWTNVARRVAPSRTLPPAATTTNAGGFFGRWHVDLSALAGARDEVRIRWRHFEPGNDWWVAIDNVLVDDVPAGAGGETVLLGPEGFVAGIPEGWSVRSDASPGDPAWTTADPCRRSVVRFNDAVLPYLDGRGVHRLGDGYAIADAGCNRDRALDEYLVTPALDLSRAEEVFLHFRDEILFDSGVVQEVLLSLDGGATFEATPLFSYNTGAGAFDSEDPFFAERVIAAPEAAGAADVAFAFHYQTSGPSELAWWAVDAVEVSASGPGVPPRRDCANRRFAVGDFDVAANALAMTWRSLNGDDGFRILAGGQIVAELGAESTSYTHAQPPAGSAVVYTLETIAGGEVEFACSSEPVRRFECARDLRCCVDRDTGRVALAWTPGVNLGGAGWEVLRDGVMIATLPFDTVSFVDDTTGASGLVVYEVRAADGNPAQCAQPLRCPVRIVTPESDVLFVEDFNCFESDAEVLSAGWRIEEVNEPVEAGAAWTITNRAGRANPPEANGAPTAGRFLISDSDASAGVDVTGSGMSHDVWTPVIDCRGAQAVWLHLDVSAMLNNNGHAVFAIDVTTDGGGEWATVFRRIAPARTQEPRALAHIPAGSPGGPQPGNTDGYFGRLHVDLTEQAAGEPAVRIRLRHFEPHDDWWVAFDNLLVDTRAPVRGSEVVLEESFADGIPSDWDAVSLGRNLEAPWTDEDRCGQSVLETTGGALPDSAAGTQLHYLGTDFAIVGGAPDGPSRCRTVPQDEWLFLPALDFSDAERVVLEFKSAILASHAIAEVVVSLDGAETFDIDEPVFSYSRGALLRRGSDEPVYNEPFLDVSHLAGEPSAIFAFRYEQPGSESGWWAISDVAVSYDRSAAPVRFRRGDVDGNGVLDITDPISSLSFQFVGDFVPPCLDALDWNDSGAIDISDPIGNLSRQFAGGPPAPAPGSESCGVDPSADDLDCREYPSC